MKKYFLLLTFLITLQFSPVAQVPENIQHSGTAIVNDSLLGAYLEDVTRWVNTCGEEGKALALRGKALGQDFGAQFRGAPLPNTKEGVEWWIAKIAALFTAGGTIVAILTRLLSLFKNVPPGTVGKIQNAFNTIRTRYLLLFSSLLVTGTGIVLFKGEGSWTVMEALLYLAGMFGVVVSGMGLTAFLKLFGINLEAKKV